MRQPQLNAEPQLAAMAACCCRDADWDRQAGHADNYARIGVLANVNRHFGRNVAMDELQAVADKLSVTSASEVADLPTEQGTPIASLRPTAPT